MQPRGWAGEHWSTAIVAEHVATRERAGLFDETSFAKIEVSGPDACAVLQRICANDVDVATGRVVYTQMLNRRGGIQCDLTVTRLGPERLPDRHRDGLRRPRPRLDQGHMLERDDVVEVRDITSALACLGLWGPRARDILSAVCADDLSDEGFPFMTAADHRWGTSRAGPARDLRRASSDGSCMPRRVRRDAVRHADRRPARPTGWCRRGYRAIDSLRLEKGYRAWGSDVTPDDSPFEAGLGFAVARDKDFIGREALERLRSRGRAAGRSPVSCWPTRARPRSATSRCDRTGGSSLA